MSKAFVDTNVLIYSIDVNYPVKQCRARQLLNGLLQQRINGVISTQVLQEYFVIATGKLGLDPIVVKGMIASMRQMELVAVDATLIDEAIDCSVLNRISFWDALIVVSAEKANCDTLWTEDLNAGQIIRGVHIENPFKDIPSARRSGVKERGSLYRTGTRKKRSR